LWYIPLCNLSVDPYTDTYNDGIIDDISIDTGDFYEIEVYKDTVTLTQTTDPQGRRVNQTLAFKVSTFADGADRDEAAANANKFYNDLLNSKEGLLFIVEDRNGVRRLVGAQSGLETDESTYESLSTKDELPGLTFNLSQLEPEFAPVLAKDYSIPVSP
jgi:hypothetical protein